eukprot:3265698-Rhodomonas_salina.1
MAPIPHTQCNALQQADNTNTTKTIAGKPPKLAPIPPSTAKIPPEMAANETCAGVEELGPGAPPAAVDLDLVHGPQSETRHTSPRRKRVSNPRKSTQRREWGLISGQCPAKSSRRYRIPGAKWSAQEGPGCAESSAINRVAGTECSAKEGMGFYLAPRQARRLQRCPGSRF